MIETNKYGVTYDTDRMVTKDTPLGTKIIYIGGDTQPWCTKPSILTQKIDNNTCSMVLLNGTEGLNCVPMNVFAICLDDIDMEYI